jgi:asparagine synthase (glutamine-hydrolysing)
MTMYRYIALMWSRTDCEAAQSAKFIAAKLHEVSPHQWSQAWDGAGLAIYHSGEHKGRMQTYRLQGERGAVLGQLFRNDYTSVVDDLGELESRKCLGTRGQRLIDHYWGRYVAFLNDPETGTRYIMRDPTGAFPCFHTPFRGVTIYFSDMQDAAYFDFLPFTVNWEYVKANIMLPMFQKTMTGLNEVSEVLPAECVEITPFERRSRFVWNPTEISQTDVVEDPDEAAELLRETVKSTIGALVGCYDRIIHNLGGLDSSIALACMAQAPNRPEITCITNFTRSPRGEERCYSRQVAEKYGVDLVEWELDYRKADLSRIFTSIKLARPLGFFDCKGLPGVTLSLAKEKGVQALFYGVGGDNVFHQAPFNFGALDYVRRHGLIGKDVLKIAMEASRYGRKSLTRTALSMLREYLAPIPCRDYIQKEVFAEIEPALVNLELSGKDSFEQFLHPLLNPDAHDLKGKYLHVLMCALFSLEYYDHWDIEYCAPRVCAYLTQPIIETCLRVPSWVMTYGGVDRGLARKAFQKDLPQDIVRRFSKSAPSEYYNDIYDHNLDFLREYLLDGVMVRDGVLLRDKVAAVFEKSDPRLNAKKFMILSYFATEVWLRGWTERPVRQLEELEIAV